jgi:hypothetical protein
MFIFFLNKLKAVDAIDRSVLSRDVGLSNFVKTESENRCANSVKLIDEKSLKWIRTLRCSYVGRKNEFG